MACECNLRYLTVIRERLGAALPPGKGPELAPRVHVELVDEPSGPVGIHDRYLKSATTPVGRPSPSLTGELDAERHEESPEDALEPTVNRRTR